MAKKIASDNIEKRIRAISLFLGQMIELMIYISPDTKCSAMLLDNNGERLTGTAIRMIVQKESEGYTSTDFRHNLAQGLADQGAAAEIISEILGHNSTVPARAYIAATPKIAEIKTKALAKNDTYKTIMKMMLTGDIISSEGVKKSKSVKGVVGFQYIGNIGLCGLEMNTPCPKNPVYSCYTCKKFNPFKDGNHDEVKSSLEKQVQLFINKSEQFNELSSNRAVIQLEQTISAVAAVIERINEGYDRNK